MLIGYLNEANLYEVPVVNGSRVWIVLLRDPLGGVQPQTTKPAGYPRYIETLTSECKWTKPPAQEGWVLPRVRLDAPTLGRTRLVRLW